MNSVKSYLQWTRTGTTLASPSGHGTYGICQGTFSTWYKDYVHCYNTWNSTLATTYTYGKFYNWDFWDNDESTSVLYNTNRFYRYGNGGGQTRSPARSGVRTTGCCTGKTPPESGGCSLIVLKRDALTFLVLVVVVGCSQSSDPSNDETSYVDCQTLVNVPRPSGFEVDLSQFDDRTRNEARDIFDAIYGSIACRMVWFGSAPIGPTGKGQ